MPPDTDPHPGDDQTAAQRASVQPPELASLRAIYDRRRRRVRLALALGGVFLAVVLAVAVWLFIRYPLRAMQQHGRSVAARELSREIDRAIRDGDDAAAAEALRKQLAQIDRNREPARWALIAQLTAGRYIFAQRYDEARAILEDAVPWAEKHAALGPDAEGTMKLIGVLADLESEQGHDTAAEPLFQRALATNERVFGGESENALMSLNDYGWFLVGRSRLDEAEPLLMRCAAGMEKTGLGNTSSMASVLDSVAHLRDKQGRLDEALELQGRAVKIARKKFGGQSSYFKKFTSYLDELEARAPGRSGEK